MKSSKLVEPRLPFGMSLNTWSSLSGKMPSRGRPRPGLVRLATRQNASLETMGEPIVIADDVYFPADEAAAAAPTGVADDARGAPDEAAAAALDEAAAPETKRRRILGKRVSVSPTSASHVVPRADDAEAASATGPAIAYHAEIGAAPADDAQPATRRRWKSTPTLAEAASAPEMWPSSLLFLKSENICRRFRTESRRFEDVMDKDEVAWENPLGRGPFGTVYGGIARVVVNQAVAIKLFQSGTRSEQAKNADSAAEQVRRP